jgi:molybdopterin-guanine dinucleotide biosynthesis protein A
VFPVLESAGRELAARQGVISGKAFLNMPWDENAEISFRPGRGESEPWWTITEAQQAAKHLWFANLNTPEEFADAEKHLDALDT